ncbi:CvpA family protein [Rhodocyclus tenuis]|uniref:Membrane protein required for colicin V production n=1 Tax=Rhodocyclus tenuis TaxID=1066 RepID=A0A840G1I8_RHOTE|nr:CvpA family protein [Rhodocyclus tenuis]MBB4248124.1 membrane protein required for colicin V production [Rhodocyclus tenuis]
MTVFDYVILGILIASAALGLWRGVVGEVIALAGWILGFFAAKAWGGEAATLLFTSIADPALRLVAGWVAVFVVTILLLALARLAVQGLLKALGLSITDRLLGVIFGVARGLLIVLALVAIGGMTSLPKERWWHEAALSPPLETAVLAARPWLPADAAKRIRFR